MIQKHYFKFLTIAVIFTSLSFYSCDAVNDVVGNDIEPESGTLIAEKQSIVPGEVVVINADFELESGTVTGYIDTEEISLDIVNNSIYFMAPDLFPGSYEINLTLNDIEYSVQINILSANEISDPAVYIENAQSLGTELVDISIELDMLMEESGIIDSVQVNENLLAIQNSLNKTNQVFSQMTMDEKAEFARIYSANEYWINEFQQIFVSTSKSSQCEYLLEQGNNAKNAGNVFEARDHFLKYKLCKIDYYANNRLVYYLNKFNKLIDELSNDNNKSTVAVGIIPAAFAIAFVYFVWTRFEADLRAMNNNPLAEELVDQKLSVETYNNNQKTNYSKRVRFRAVDQNDINRQDLFGKFVGMIHDANEAIKKLLGIVSDADIEPVTLSNSSQTIDFNRNFVIQNISNSNVKLKSTAFVDDMWEVVFETSELTNQEFDYELVYDDSKSKVTKTFSAVLKAEPEYVTDIEGNVYLTVKIGEQIWMAENLRTTKYNDGASIANVTDNMDWGFENWDNTPTAYSWYNNSTSYKEKYGALYNLKVVQTGKLCPTGWHVPTNEEWSDLITFLGGKNTAGGKLKESGTINWTSPNTGTNSSGFTALPGGLRIGYSFDSNEIGEFTQIGYQTLWWSSTEEYGAGTRLAFYRGVTNDSDYVIGTTLSIDGRSGLSVRCIKD
jgi:uncharacterized protein (TIGR02145 family)